MLPPCLPSLDELLACGVFQGFLTTLLTMRVWPLLVAVAPLANALGQAKIVSFDDEGGLRLAGPDLGAGQILVSSNEYWGVIRAAGDLAVDFGRVTGTNYTLSNGNRGADPAEFVFEPADISNHTHVSSL